MLPARYSVGLLTGEIRVRPIERVTREYIELVVAFVDDGNGCKRPARVHPKRRPNVSIDDQAEECTGVPPDLVGHEGGNLPPASGRTI